MCHVKVEMNNLCLLKNHCSLFCLKFQEFHTEGNCRPLSFNSSCSQESASSMETTFLTFFGSFSSQVSFVPSVYPLLDTSFLIPYIFLPGGRK